MADNFERYSNYKNNAGVSGIVFGANRPVLEVEMNEMQDIMNNFMRTLVENMIGNGITDKSKITYSNGTLKIGSGCYFAVSGMLINCTGLSLAVSNGSTAYLQVWEDVVTNAETLKEEGNQQSDITVPNWIRDSRSDVETSRRKVIKYTLATSSDEQKHNLAIASIDTSGKMTILLEQTNLANLSSEVLKNYFGLKAVTTKFNPDGSITETIGGDTVRTTTFNSDGSISESIAVGGKVLYNKKTTFSGDTIKEEVL